MMFSSIRKKVKIVCTLGPSTSSPEKLKALIAAGMNVARLNFSHGQYDEYARLIRQLRKIDPTVAILQDLQGPKLRVGALPSSGFVLQPQEQVVLYPEGEKPPFLSSTHETACRTLPISREIAHAASQVARPGEFILFDDGKLNTRILSVDSKKAQIRVQVKVGGTLSSHKGMNLPGLKLPLACFTEKDLKDLNFGLAHQVDAVALSFVRSAEDLLWLRAYLKKKTSLPPLLIPKIELEEAIQNQESILEVSDALLIARGDMAVEIGAARVPIVQKQLIRRCNQVGIPVITATQMLESMVHAPTPTRAEATDVANAVFDGTDAVMLSSETATGNYPVEAVQTMTQIILEAEKFQASLHQGRHRHSTAAAHESVVDAIENSAALIAEQIQARVITCITRSGRAARALAKYRPITPIVALVPHEGILRRLAFVWGVYSLVLSHLGSTDRLLVRVRQLLKKKGCVKPKDLVIFTAGIPSLKQGSTNMIQVERVV